MLILSLLVAAKMWTAADWKNAIASIKFSGVKEYVLLH